MKQMRLMFVQHRVPQASQGPPTGESPHGSFLGRTMSISIRRESRVP